MKQYLLAVALAATIFPAQAADVGVSVSVGQPGFYGHIEIGDFPRPQLVYSKPVIIQQSVGVVRQPVYMHVPPGHQKKWSKHCHKYNACGQPVYFVSNSWYNNEYVPLYSKKHGNDREEHNNDRGQGRKNDNHEEGGKGKGKHKDKN